MLGILPGRSLTYISWVPFLLLFSSLTAPSSFTSIWELVRNARSWDSPGGGPMVRTPYFYCSGSVLGWGTKFPHSSTKKKMQIPGPYLRSTEVQTLGMGPSNLFQHSCPSGWCSLTSESWGRRCCFLHGGHGSVLAAPGNGAPWCQLAFSKSSPHLSPPLISHLLWSPYQPPCLSSHGPDVNPGQNTWTFYLQSAELTQRLLFLVNDIPGGASGKEPARQCRWCKRCEVSSLGREDSLEKSMTTHSSVLAWRTPWTEEWSTGSHRVGHN